MKIGISSYCYHRYFGDVYEGLQKTPSKRMTIDDFIERAFRLKVDAVSLEESYFKSHSVEYLTELKHKLDTYKLERTYSWGYPHGLEGGSNQKAYEQMIEHIGYAKTIGAKVMRVIGSSDMVNNENRNVQIDRLSSMFSSAAKIAEKAGIKLAQANHSDFYPEELLKIAKNVNSPYFGINVVTGNFVRVHTDPIEGMKKLVPYIFGVDVKDVKPQKDVSLNTWHYYASTPLGEGIVDDRKMVELLEKGNYTGTLFLEIDYMHPDYNLEEDEVVARSISYLKEIVKK